MHIYRQVVCGNDLVKNNKLSFYLLIIQVSRLRKSGALFIYSKRSISKIFIPIGI